MSHKKTLSENHLEALYLIRKLLPYLWSNSWQFRLLLFLSLACVGISSILSIVVPLIFKKIIATFSLDNTINSTVFYLLLSYGLFWTLRHTTAALKTIALLRVVERGRRAMSLDVFDHLFNLSLRFHLERRTGAITNIVERAYDAFDNVFWGILLFMIPIILEILGVFTVITCLYGPYYSILILSIMTGYILFNIVALRWTLQARYHHNQKKIQAATRLVDSLLNFETVRYFNNKSYEYTQINQVLQEREDAATQRALRETLMQVGEALIIGTGLTILTIISGFAVTKGLLQISDFVLINGYILQFIMPLQHFGYILQQIRRGLNDIEDVVRLMRQKPEIQDSPQAISLPLTKDIEINFNNVSFNYTPDRPILKGISFTVPAGKTIAIVGPSGAGKSTITRLLFRFYDVTQGSISINGQDIRTLAQESLQKAIGVVPQDTVLFNNTLRYNIAYGQPTASSQEIEHAAKLAHLDKFIKNLPEGYNTPVGERGLKLSGGEKQRIAIARVLLKKPLIYVFDEATSSLDTATEQEIQQNLEEISAGSTTIIIAHRLSTVIHADEILVLNEGIIVERGTHPELLKLHGLYAQLWKQQADHLLS